jgi:hypothetical protein
LCQRGGRSLLRIGIAPQPLFLASARRFGMDVRCVGGSIPSNASAQITLTMQAPSTAGAYAVTSTVDPYAEIVEGSESNNAAAVTLFVN